MDSWYTNRLGLPRAAKYARKAGQQRIPAETVRRSTGTFTVENGESGLRFHAVCANPLREET